MLIGKTNGSSLSRAVPAFPSRCLQGLATDHLQEVETTWMPITCLDNELQFINISQDSNLSQTPCTCWWHLFLFNIHNKTVKLKVNSWLEATMGRNSLSLWLLSSALLLDCISCVRSGWSRAVWIQKCGPGEDYLISGLICLIGNCPWGKVLAVGQVRISVAWRGGRRKVILLQC